MCVAGMRVAIAVVVAVTVAVATVAAAAFARVEIGSASNFVHTEKTGSSRCVEIHRASRERVCLLTESVSQEHGE